MSRKRNRRDFVGQDIYGAHLKPKHYMASGQGSSREEMIERMFIRILTEMCMNRFEWKGLPDEINVRFLEQTLFRNGMALFWKHTAYESAGKTIPGTDKFMATRANITGRLNYYDAPTRFTSVGLGLTPRQLVPNVSCVPIWSNYTRVPNHDIVLIYASRLANFDRTIEINARNARQNRIIGVTESGRLTAENVNNMIERGQQTIPINTDTFDPGAITALDMGMHPDKLEKLHITKKRIWSGAMGLLGINNANQDKKERLVADEVDANNEQVESMRIVNLNARQQACEQINRLYGLNVSVEYKVVNEHKEQEKEAKDNGNIHDGIEDSRGAAE